MLLETHSSQQNTFDTYLIDYFMILKYHHDMDDKTIDTLLEQKDALGKKIQRLTKRLEELKGLEAQMESAFRVIGSIDPRFGQRLAADAAPKTVSDMALRILKEHPNGLTAQDILEKIQNRWMPGLVRTSLSPPLSRLKHLGEVSYRNGIWSLELRKNNIRNSRIHSEDIYINQSDNEDSLDDEENS